MAGSCLSQTIGPIGKYELHLDSDDTILLEKIMKKYSKKEGFAINSIGDRLPTSQVMKPVIDRKPFFVILQKADSQIIVNNFKEKNKFLITLYSQNNALEASEFKKFIALLQAQWPNMLMDLTDN